MHDHAKEKAKEAIKKKHSFGDYLTYMKKHKGKGMGFKDYKKMDHDHDHDKDKK